MEEIISGKNAKHARGFVTVQLFDEFGHIVQEEKIENDMTSLVTDRMKWRLKQDFYNGHPGSTLTEPLYPLNAVILYTPADSTIYKTAPLYRNIGIPIGWSDKTNYSGTDTFRGTINSVESYTNSNRVHYVFDWPTHAANGTFQNIAWCNISNDTIASVSLKALSSYNYGVIRYQRAIAWVDNYIWTGGYDDANIYKIKPNTNEKVDYITIQGGSPRGLAWDGNYLWYTNNNNNYIYKIDLNTKICTPEFQSPDSASFGIAWAGSILWIVGRNAKKIYKFNPETKTVLGTIEFPTPDIMGIAWDGLFLWATDNSTNTIFKINPNNGTVLGTFSRPGTNSLSGITFDGTYLWVTTEYGRTAEKIDAAIGTITKLPNPVTKTSTNTMKIQYDFIFED